MSGAVSGAQFGAAQQGYKNPYATADDPTALGDVLGGWKGGETPSSQGSQNLTSAGQAMAWRSPTRTAQGSQTVGSWYGFGPSWHDRYKSES
jgi:hypothetical protein